jgi:hydrogenase maturation protease
MQTECLVRGGPGTVVHVNVRFLHLQGRLVGQLACSVAALAKGEEPVFEVVERLKVGNRLLQTWQKAVQREVALLGLDVNTHTREPAYNEFSIPGGRKIEGVHGSGGEIEAILVRENYSISGRLQASAEPLGEDVFKLRVRIENRTTPESAGTMSRDRAVLHAFASTHIILSVQAGEFCSLIDPPAEFKSKADACRNEGTWPVLVGREGEKDAVLSSPIILYDYPQVAAESPGEFFDGTEIDEMLVLRILTLTEEEKQAAAAVDQRVQALLTRTGSLSNEQVMGLHGTVRGLRPISLGESP